MSFKILGQNKLDPAPKGHFICSYFDRTDSVFTERVRPQWHIGELRRWYICLSLHQKEAPSRWETNLWPEQWLLHVLCLRRSHWWLVPPPLFISLIQTMWYSWPGNILSYMCHAMWIKIYWTLQVNWYLDWLSQSDQIRIKEYEWWWKIFLTN